MALFLLYIWLKLDDLGHMLTAMTVVPIVVFLIGLVISTIGVAANYEQNDHDGVELWSTRRRAWSKRLKPWLICSLACFVVSFLLPTQRQGAYLIAGYAGLEIAETPEMGKLTELVRLKVGNYLDDELKAAKADAVKAVASAVGK